LYPQKLLKLNKVL